MRKVALFFTLIMFSALPLTAAHAYIGPGAGAGTIAIVLGILSSIFLAFVGILWYPLKRLLKGKKSGAKADQKSGSAINASGHPTSDSAPSAVASHDRR